jgi:hypothetical protein
VIVPRQDERGLGECDEAYAQISFAVYELRRRAALLGVVLDQITDVYVRVHRFH